MDDDGGDDNEYGRKKAKARKRPRAGYLLDDFASVGAADDETGARGRGGCGRGWCACRGCSGSVHGLGQRRATPALACAHAARTSTPAESVGGGGGVPRQRAASRQYIEDTYLQRKRRRERYK